MHTTSSVTCDFEPVLGGEDAGSLALGELYACSGSKSRAGSVSPRLLQGRRTAHVAPGGSTDPQSGASKRGCHSLSTDWIPGAGGRGEPVQAARGLSRRAGGRRSAGGQAPPAPALVVIAGSRQDTICARWRPPSGKRPGPCRRPRPGLAGAAVAAESWLTPPRSALRHPRSRLP